MMELSPNDIRGYEFSTQMRGYDKNDVDALLEQVASALEAAHQEEHYSKANIESLKTELAELRKFEDAIKAAAIDARCNADATIAAAKEEAAQILSDAKGEAEKEIAARSHQMDNLEEQLKKLTSTKESYFTQVRQLVQSHLDMINELEVASVSDSPSEESIHVTDSNEVGGSEPETMIAETETSATISSNTTDSLPANEPSEMSDSSKMLLSKALQGVLKDNESADTPGPVDPDLAQALEDYKKLAETVSAEPATDDASEAPVEPSPKAISEMVETDSLADDIPAGFIAKAEEVKHENFGNSTDRDEGLASKTPKSDKSASDDDKNKSPLEPNSLSSNLDAVAEKFEQEMNKAEHN